MNTTKIQFLLGKIEAAGVLTVDDSPLLHSVDISDPIGEDDNEIVFANWHDDDGNEFQVKFTESGLNDAVVKNNIIKLIDHEGELSVIALFDIIPKNIEQD